MKRNSWILAICFALVVGLFASCDKYSGEQEIPSYLKIEGLELVANPNAGFGFPQDSSFLTSAITEVAVFVTADGRQDNMGVYTLGKDGTLLIPLLKKGKCVIELEPVVKLNGMNATRAYYVFYTTAKDTIELEEGKIDTIHTKTVSYTTSTSICKRIFFEDTFNPFTNAAITDSALACRMNLLSSKDSVAYGNRCGAFYSTSSKDNFKIITKDSIVGTGNKTMMLEFDYCSNIPFEVGIYGQASSAAQNYYISSVRMGANYSTLYKPNDKRNWQKMYITLGKVWANINNNPFKLWFMPVNSSNNPKGFVHVDNIKLVTVAQ